MKKKEIPQVKAFIDEDYNQITFWCCFCQTWHRHGQGYGHRGAHCHFHSPMRDYELIGYTDKELKKILRMVKEQLGIVK
ncbi:hypothetical protein HOE91_02680 [archaeon]|jgi:hypothetical protein|nr:hypothetical protein [archaeon]